MPPFKYVIFEATDTNGNRYAIPVMFPLCINHDEMYAEARCALRSTDNGMRPGAVIGAGFCSITDKGEVHCTGKSESLNIKSRGKLDTAVFRDSAYGRVRLPN